MLHGKWGIPKNPYVNVVNQADPSGNVVVKITDTGALGDGDVIDLSAAAMKTLTSGSTQSGFRENFSVEDRTSVMPF